MGASGSGTTTLGAALGARLGCRHVDSDDLFWVKTEPPFTLQRLCELLVHPAAYAYSPVKFARAVEKV